jgi:hypothetical protein
MRYRLPDGHELSRSPLVAGLILAVAGIFVPRVLAYLRSSFGIARGLQGQRHPEADRTRAAEYYRALPELERAGGLDDATWHDLTMDDVFSSADRTESQPGAQFLYKTIRTPSRSIESLARMDDVVRRFSRDDALASEVRKALRGLSDPRAAYLVSVLFGVLPRRPGLWWTFPILTVASFSCLGVVYFWPPAAIVWLAICAINICIQLFYKQRVTPFVAAYHEIPSMLRVARSLGGLTIDEVAKETSLLARNEHQLRLLRRATSWLVFEPGQTSSWSQRSMNI